MSKITRSILIVSIALISSVIILMIDIPGLRQGGKITLMLFVVAALFWMSEVIPLYVTSLIILVIEVLILVPSLVREGIQTSHKEFMAPFFSDIILLFLGGLLLSKAGSKYQIDKWIASIVMKVVGGKSSLVLLGLILTSAWLSMWMSNTATTAMMLLIALAISKELPESELGFRKALFLGVPFACNLGGMGTPVGSPPNAIAIAFLQKSNISISFLSWMTLSVPILSILLLVLWRVLLIFYPAPNEKLELKHQVSFPAQWKARGTAVVFSLTVILWLTGRVHGISSGMVGLIAAILLLSFKILDSNDFRNISWDLLFLVGGGISLGLAMSKSGLSAWMVGSLPIKDIGFTALFAVFILTGTILTTFMSNTATANILIPIAVSMNTEFSPLIVGAALAVSASMSLPVSTPPNAIAYYSGEIQLKEMFRIGAIISTISSIALIIAGRFYWKLIGFY